LRTFLLLALIAAAGASATAFAQLTIQETPEAIVVSHAARPAWRIKLDLKQGGVATALHLSGGPNLVADNGGFTGMFNLFMNGRTGDPRTPGQNSRALIKRGGTVESARVVERTATRITVEIKGRSTGFGRLLGPAGEKLLDYRQTLTFEPRRIVCDGELTWVYGYDTKPVEMSVMNYFVPNSVAFPVRAAGAEGKWQELPLAWSRGEAFPAGMKHPITAEVWFRSGQRVLFRSIKVPPPWRDCPWYKYENPWQTDWQPLFGFSGNTETCDTRYPVGQPVAYTYELDIPAEQPRNTPPLVEITKPVRGVVRDLNDVELYSGLRFRAGDVIQFEASARDKEDGALPGSGIEWTVYPKGLKPYATGTGTPFRFRVPETRDELWWVAATAKDSQGLRGIDYITFKADVGVK